MYNTLQTHIHTIGKYVTEMTWDISMAYRSGPGALVKLSQRLFLFYLACDTATAYGKQRRNVASQKFNLPNHECRKSSILYQSC